MTAHLCSVETDKTLWKLNLMVPTHSPSTWYLGGVFQTKTCPKAGLETAAASSEDGQSRPNSQFWVGLVRAS